MAWKESAQGQAYGALLRQTDNPYRVLDSAAENILRGNNVTAETKLLVAHYIRLGRFPPKAAEETQPIRFRYAGAPIPVEHDSSFFYSRTNESYPQPFLKVVERLRGIGSYVGILGGGDQHIPILSALQKHNSIRSGVLVDQNASQILQGMLAMTTYNKLWGEGEHDLRNQWSWPLFGKAKLDPIEIEFVHSKIQDVVEELPKDRYFIISLMRYLSGVSQACSPERGRAGRFSLE